MNDSPVTWFLLGAAVFFSGWISTVAAQEDMPTAVAESEHESEHEADEFEELHEDDESVAEVAVAEIGRKLIAGSPTILAWIFAAIVGVGLMFKGRVAAGGLLSVAAVIHLFVYIAAMLSLTYLWFIAEDGFLIDNYELSEAVIYFCAALPRAIAWLMIIGAVVITASSDERSISNQ